MTRLVTPFISLSKQCLLVLPVLCALSGCIKNDLPYPTLVAEVTSMEVENASAVTITSASKSISIKLEEVADIHNVNIKSVKFKHDITSCEPGLAGIHDLSSSKKFTLTTYQDYTWMVVATQHIERYFTVKGQIGEPIIDEANRRVVITVSPDVDLEQVTITSMKLGPKDISKYNINSSEPQDLSEGLDVYVSYSGKIELWQIFAIVSETTVEMKSISPWTGCCWLTASGIEGNECGFLWRTKNGQEWQEATGVTQEGGIFKVCLDGLEPLTQYECLAYCGEDRTEICEFTTEEARQLPNCGFETFSNAESNVYKSWYDPLSSSPELKNKWWDSGNVGSTTLGEDYCIALPDLMEKKSGNASACCVSRYVVVKFAAGNTFCGSFDHLVGTSGGVIHFGRPWTLRPRAVRLWAKYECGTIDVVDTYPAERPVKEGDPDMCSMIFALGDWDYKKYGGDPESPVMVNTTDKSTLFNPDAEAVIAFGSFYSDKSTDGWVQLEIPLEYRSLERRPTYIVVSFASSSLGDYFTGSSKSKLWIDDIELIY